MDNLLEGSHQWLGLEPSGRITATEAMLNSTKTRLKSTENAQTPSFSTISVPKPLFASAFSIAEAVKAQPRA